jgi:enoyl-CoA hydratase/carnithine racemase
MATRLAKGPSLTISLAKASLYKAMTMDFFSELDNEINVQSLCMTSSNGREGLSAFLEKRKPDFSSKQS